MRNFVILAVLVGVLVGNGFATVQSVAQETTQETIPVPRPRLNRIAPIDQTGQPDVQGTAPVDASTVIEQTFSGPPQPVTLSAKLVDEGPLIPGGLVWRVFDARPNALGQLPLVLKSTDATAAFTLAPGQYVVHVAYGNTQTSDTFDVLDQASAKTLVLDAGALRLNGAITGDIAIPANQLTFDIYPGGRDRDERRPLVADVKPGEVIHLNAGTYFVVSRYGSLNAVVRTDLRVEPGQLTEATLFHHAATVSFRLVSEIGGEAIADIEWRVLNSDGETVYEALSAFPMAILAEGDYSVLAKRGSAVFNREFSVTPGPAQEIELLTSLR